jgi:hypothetical protein
MNMMRFTDANIQFVKPILANVGINSYGNITLNTGNLHVVGGTIGVGTAPGGSQLAIYNASNQSRVYINDASTSFPSISLRSEKTNGGSWYHIHNTSGTNGINALQITHGGKAGDNLVASFTSTGMGIGIANPKAKIDVQGGSIIQGTTELYDDAGNSHIRFNSSGGRANQNGFAGFFRFNKDATGSLEYFNTSNSSVAGSDNNTGMKRVFWVSKEGRFCIGNKAPINSTAYTDWKLSVDGRIVAQKLNLLPAIDNSWADYVFASNYKLKSIEEAEQFWKQNGHLHFSTKGSEIEEKSLETFNTLREHQIGIEELFLHTAELKKELAKSQQLIQHLQSQNATLQKTIEFEIARIKSEIAK